MKILIIDNDPGIAAYLSKNLTDLGHTADIAHDGAKGLLLAATGKYDALIIERILPGLDGLTLIKTLRGAGNHTPILILSTLGDVDDRVTGLKSGCDDYLVKPFALAELMARLDIMHRRSLPAPVQAITHLHCRDIKVDLIGHSVTRGNQTLNIKGREFRLLEYLLRNKSRIVTRSMLLENIWNSHSDPLTNMVDVHISRLRGKIDTEDASYLIKTVRGSGYIIED